MSATQKPSNNTWKFVLRIAIIPIVIALIGAIALIIGKSQTTIIIQSPSTITPAPTLQATTFSSPTAGSTATSPVLSPTPMVFDNFNNGIGGWGIPGNDVNVSAAQDNGNGVLRFNPPNQGAAEAYKNVGSAALSKFNKIYLRINLHGAILPTQASDPTNYKSGSALYLNKNSIWKYVALVDYITNGYEGWQDVYIPLTNFAGFDKAASFDTLGFHFWLQKAGTIDVDDITFES